MDNEQRVSRRHSLRSLGTIGVATVLGSAAVPPVEASEPQKKMRPGADTAELAVARFGKGHSCAQAVFSAFAEQMGMDCGTAVKLTSSFGGGMGMGSVCGAITGAFMALGLRFGGVDPKAKEHTSKLSRAFVQRFKAVHRCVNCRELLGCDPTTPEGRRIMQEKNLRATVCTGAIRDAVKLANELLTQ